MSNNDDLVSIIMPSYNNAQYIVKSIDSVLKQTYQNWELIIVDDCSSDNTDEAVLRYTDYRIRYFKNKENLGAAKTRNFALREAKGVWIAFLDSDDQWHPEKLSKQMLFMKENNYNFSYTDYRICLNGKWMPYINTGPDIINKKKMYDYCYISTLTVMYNKNAIGLIQIADLRKNNDYAMWLQAIEKSDCYRLPECLAYYIKHEGSISSGKKIGLVKWHYILFREGLKKSAVISIFLTINNLIHGVWKKIYYKKLIKE